MSAVAPQSASVTEDEAYVLVEQQGGVRTLWLNRPRQFNPLSEEMLDALDAALAVRAAKECIDRGLEVDLDSGLEIERMQFAGVFATQDAADGMRSFVENGPGQATFHGR